MQKERRRERQKHAGCDRDQTPVYSFEKEKMMGREGDCGPSEKEIEGKNLRSAHNFKGSMNSKFNFCDLMINSLIFSLSRLERDLSIHLIKDKIPRSVAT